MGAIAVWITEHAKLIAAWSIIIAAVAVFVSAIENSRARDVLQSASNSAVSLITQAASAVPRTITNLNNSLASSLDNDDNGMAQMMYWLFGVDSVLVIFQFVALNFNALGTAIAALSGVTMLLLVAYWTMKRVQNFAVILSGGKTSGVKVID